MRVWISKKFKKGRTIMDTIVRGFFTSLSITFFFLVALSIPLGIFYLYYLFFNWLISTN